MLDMMATERKVDVFGFVTRIRAQRCQMVQTEVGVTSNAGPDVELNFGSSLKSKLVWIHDVAFSGFGDVLALVEYDTTGSH